MNCQSVHQFLADYLSGALPWRQRLVFRLHLLFCRDCREYLASYAATIRMAKTLGESAEPVPEELTRAILAAQGVIRQSEVEQRSADADTAS
jgi:predicted anti-sigma-YlaC factor YlaD